MSSGASPISTARLMSPPEIISAPIQQIAQSTASTVYSRINTGLSYHPSAEVRKFHSGAHPYPHFRSITHIRSVVLSVPVQFRLQATQ
jgi:hypothetical protein